MCDEAFERYRSVMGQRKGGRNAAESNGLETDLRRQIDFARPLHRKLELDCKSQYWITGGKVRWARRWSREEIDAGRAGDRLAKQKYFKTSDVATHGVKKKPERSFWGKLRKRC